MKYVTQYKEVLRSPFFQRTVKENVRHSLRQIALDFLSFQNKLINLEKYLSKPRIQFLYVHHVFSDELEKFESLLTELMKYHEFISYSDAVEKIHLNQIDKPYIVVSTDDGFKNNYTIASKILQKKKLKAIFYITTEFINCNRSSWIDYIEQCVEFNEKGVFNFSWGIEEFSNNKKSKILFLSKIRNKVKNNPKINISRITEYILERLNCDIKENITIPIFEKMNWNDVNNLKNNELFTIGGHSHSHQILSSMSYNNLLNDIGTSIELINKNLKINLRHYSYPEGMSHTYSDREINLLKKNGIKCCPTAIPGINNIHSDLFNLKRIPCI